MKFRALWGADTTDFGPSYARGSVQMARAVDGSLAARRTVIGVAFLPPFAIFSVWQRFEPATKE